MTQTPPAPTPDDIVLEDDDLTHRLDREADALIAEGRAGGEPRTYRPVSSVREAVREDAALLRDRAYNRLDSAREAVRDHPTESTLYALGVGVLIGLLLSR